MIFLPLMKYIKSSKLFFIILLSLTTFYIKVYAEEADQPKTKKELENKKDSESKNELEIKKDETKKETETERIGNFSLPSSQEPTPLTSFGDHVVDQGDLQFFLQADAFTGPRNYKTDVIPGLLYGITDDLTIFFNVPFAPKNKEGRNKSSGIQDIFIQLEYAFYKKNEKYSAIQATIVGNFFLPTGSNKKTPRTGFGSPSFLIGSVLDYTTINWIFAGGLAGVLTTKSDNYQAGNQFIYQAAIGRNLYASSKWIVALFLEFSGQYSQKDTVHNRKDPNSGGNIIYMIPTVWISSEKHILQFGIGGPIVQNPFGHQLKQHMSYIFNFGWTF